jgi:dephospho-CoA kinase
MLNVAVTGNAAAGKSAVVKWFREWGAAVIDADEIVRDGAGTGLAHPVRHRAPVRIADDPR